MDKATARAADWGASLAWGMMGFGALEIFGGALVGGLWLILIGLFLRSAAIREYQGTVMGHLLQRVSVDDIMIRNPVTIGSDTPVSDAIEHYFLRYGYGGFPVVEDGRTIGTLTLSQVRHCPPQERERRRVCEIMRGLDPGIVIDSRASAMDAIRKMNAANIGRLLVMDGDRLSGLITRTGVMRFMEMKAQLEAPFESPRESA